MTGTEYNGGRVGETQEPSMIDYRDERIKETLIHRVQGEICDDMVRLRKYSNFEWEAGPVKLKDLLCK